MSASLCGQVVNMTCTARGKVILNFDAQEV